MTARFQIRPLMLATLLTGAGCGALTADPGSDYAVRILDASPITAIGMIDIPVNFAVTGCEAFDTVVVGSDGSIHSVSPAARPGGTHQVTVPVAWLRGSGCGQHQLADARAPTLIEGRLIVTCRDAGRVAEVPVDVSYAAATQINLGAGRGFPQTPVQLLTASVDPLRPYVLGPSLVEPWAGLEPLHIGVPVAIDFAVIQSLPLARPRVASTATAPGTASTVFLSGGCFPAGSCPKVDVSATSSVDSELLVGLDEFGLFMSGLLWDPVWVPTHVVDLSALADGTVVVLSQVVDAMGRPTASAVTRVVPAPALRNALVEVIGYFPGEIVQSRFSRPAPGQLSFLSYVLPATDGPIHSVIHATDGLSVTSSADPTGSLFIGEVANGYASVWFGAALAPDASSMVIQGTYLVSADGAWSQLPRPLNCFESDRGGAAWLGQSIALWCGTSPWFDPGSSPSDWGIVEVFDAALPHGQIYQYEVHPLGDVAGTSILHGVVSVGDLPVLTTNTGIRVLGPDGKVVAGSDPMPCGLVPTSVAIQSGPTTAAVAAGDYVFVFDLAGVGAN